MAWHGIDKVLAPLYWNVMPILLNHHPQLSFVYWFYNRYSSLYIPHKFSNRV